MKTLRIRIGLAAAAATLAVALVLVTASGGRAIAASRRCPGAFPPKRPELANFRVSGMSCWAAKLLLDEAIEQRVGSRRRIVLLGFRCRFRNTTEASGVVSCAGRGASARADFAVF